VQGYLQLAEDKRIKMSKLSDYQLEEIYKDALDDSWPFYIIAGMEYSPSQILRECDPIAYRVGLSDFLGTQECECGEVYTDCTCEVEE
jgi:hypothetical protein